MTTHRNIVDALTRAADDGQSLVMGTVVHVTGSSYGGVGARMLVHADDSTVGLVSGGCLEADLAEHARLVRESKVARVVTYDTRADDDSAWGLGLGCNGLIEVLLESLQPPAARAYAAILEQALGATSPSVLATVIGRTSASSVPEVGAHAFFDGANTETMGGWGDREILGLIRHDIPDAMAKQRRGLLRTYGTAGVAFEVIAPAVRLIVCGSGPDVIPLVRLARELGWNTTVVDHRPVDRERSQRFLGASVVECGDPAKLDDSVSITPQTACVVMAHNYARDLEYIGALLKSPAAYIGALGPRKRTERMLAEMNADEIVANDSRLFAPIGMDVGAEGPDGIALSIVAEVAAVMSGREGGHLRDRRGSLHGRPSGI
ncbi:MAG: XdhC family protein [Gemmatimonadaceae bacterium]